MKIRINSVNKESYINSLINSINMFLDYCNDYPDDKKYNYYKGLAEKLLNDYNKIGLNILQFCYGVENINSVVYPSKMLHSLYNFRNYVYSDDKLLSLSEQQEKAKNYIHFDFSIKRVKTLLDI